MAHNVSIPVKIDGVANNDFYLTTLCTPLKNTYVGCKIKDICEKKTPEGIEITITFVYRTKK